MTNHIVIMNPEESPALPLQKIRVRDGVEIFWGFISLYGLRIIPSLIIRWNILQQWFWEKFLFGNHETILI